MRTADEDQRRARRETVDDEIDQIAGLHADDVMDIVQDQDERLVGRRDQLGDIIESDTGAEIDVAPWSIGESIGDRVGEHEWIVVDGFEVEPPHSSLVVDDPTQYLCRFAVAGWCQDAQHLTGRRRIPVVQARTLDDARTHGRSGESCTVADRNEIAHRKDPATSIRRRRQHASGSCWRKCTQRTLLLNESGRHVDDASTSEWSGQARNRPIKAAMAKADKVGKKQLEADTAEIQEDAEADG